MRAALERRGADAAAGLDRVIELDERRRALLPELEGLRAEQNEANSRIKSAGSAEERECEIAAMRTVAARAKELEHELNAVEGDLQAVLAPLPNLADPTAAPGPEDELVREVGETPAFDFEPRDHLELAGEGIDMDRAARLSGACFAYLKGDLVMLALALVRWVLGGPAARRASHAQCSVAHPSHRRGSPPVRARDPRRIPRARAGRQGARSRPPDHLA